MNIAQVDEAVLAATKSFPSWSQQSFNERRKFLKSYEDQLKKHEGQFAETISKETGKPLWESKQEVRTMIQKIDISIEAYRDRCPEKRITEHLSFRHKPHGVVAVLGPFNFPGHLPNGHIVPALLAGNTVIFKVSEHTPKVGEKMSQFFEGLPKGVFNLVQGGGSIGHALASHPKIDGIFFTGSYATGMKLLEETKGHPEKILALEMGGNNPLVVWDIADLEAAAYLTIQSAYLTSGQRCSCARRLIIPTGREGEEFLKVLVHMTESIEVGPYTNQPEPFMGPVISRDSANRLLTAQATLGTEGGIPLVEMRMLEENTPLLTPGLMDVTPIKHRPDEELFGPFLQVIRVPNFEAAIHEANRTSYGLTASLFTRSETKFRQFFHQVKAGVINWNGPTTGASSKAPFGGVGKSGNHHPSGYYAADYCSYPVASMESSDVSLPKQRPPGITLLARS